MTLYKKSHKFKFNPQHSFHNDIMPVLSLPQRPRLLQDFLIPHLNNGTFGDKLYWVDKRKGIFAMFWIHQSSSRFVNEDSIVFKEWAKAKNLWNPCTSGALTKAKQRVRAALLKLRNVQCIRRENERRVYKITSQDEEEEENYEEMPAQMDNVQIFQEQRIVPKAENSEMRAVYSDYDEQEVNWFIDQLLKMNSENRQV